MFATSDWEMNALFLSGLEQRYEDIVYTLEHDEQLHIYGPLSPASYWDIVARVVKEEERLKIEEEQWTLEDQQERMGLNDEALMRLGAEEQDDRKRSASDQIGRGDEKRR